MTHFIIVGAGAIGCFLGGKLALAGARVSFVARAAMACTLRTEGLLVQDFNAPTSMLSPARFAVLDAIDGADFSEACILLCTKSGATEQAAREIAAAAPVNTMLISMQNGVRNMARIRLAAPSLDSFAGMVPYNVVLNGNHAKRASDGGLIIEQHARTQSLAPEFEAADLGLRFVLDMQSVQWGKLLLNLNNPVNAWSGLPLRDELSLRGYRLVLAGMMREGLQVLSKARIKPARVTPVPASLLPFLLSLPDSLFRVLARSLLRIDPSARSSMADDFRKRQSTEIDELCGALVALGQKLGVPTPLNAGMVKIVHAYAGLGPLPADQLMRAIQHPESLAGL
jgi:2-dehydropantoate 2-reductase